MAPEALEAMLPYLSSTGVFGNPASIQHCFGEAAESIIKNARRLIADQFGANPNDFIFTSGATESNNLALKGIALSNRSKGKHITPCANMT